MEGLLLRFYVEERQRHAGVLLWEWLLDRANALGVRGGSALRAIGGFGRHRAIHENRFFEQADQTGVEIEFVATEDEVEQLLTLVRDEGIRLFYTCIPASFGVVNADKGGDNNA